VRCDSGNTLGGILLGRGGVVLELGGDVSESAQLPETTAVDVPWLVMDHTRATRELGWFPRMSPEAIVEDIASWLEDNRFAVQSLLL
jgi:nucleoside-diphosphate-sugar epimerase